uniref:Uncharacterized protein n=1 Tax=Pfiesteria piscicida TaxID=71001 RepID=A3E3R5_PFIPI|nr:unknown [Pfiesteria piscicida]
MVACWLPRLFLATVAAAALGADTVDHDCQVVDSYLHPDKNLKPGDGTCFPHDDEGMVCGWDGTKNEAFCVKDTEGDLVCARAKAGGKCKGLVDGAWLTEKQRSDRRSRKEL